MSRIWLRMRHDLPNAVIVLLAGGAVVEAIVTTQHVNRTVQIPAAFFFALPLLARHRFPILAPAVVFAAASLDAEIDTRGANNLNFLFFCALAAMVCAGAARDRNQAVAAGGIGLAAVLWVQNKLPHSASDFLWILLFFSATWVVGRAFVTRTQQAHELRARAETAEREHAQAAERAAADERARIARELHDVVAHSVSVMVVQSSGVRRLLRDDQHREREALLSVEQIGRQALTEMRRMLGVMRTAEESPALTPQPSLRHLDRLIARVEAAGLPVTLRVEGELPELTPSVDLSAYRIVQEGLTNALKHANGTHAEVLLRCVDSSLELEISDDGSGDSEANGVGHGLVGMRERVALYGGTLEAGPRDGGGFVVSARLPVEARP